MIVSYLLDTITMKGFYCINAIQCLATGQSRRDHCLFWKCVWHSNPTCALFQAIIDYMAGGGGAKAHLNTSPWKVSSMRGDRGHERETSAHMEAEVRLGMRSEEERLQTFQNWPRDAPVRPADLARAGFFYLRYRDTVQCFCCAGILRYWVQGDTPLGEHERHFPACGFVMGRDVGNVPTGSSDSVDGQLLSQLQRMTVDEQVVPGQAMYPEMDSEDSRLTTYHNWPTGASVQPDILARAGFFYTGLRCLCVALI